MCGAPDFFLLAANVARVFGGDLDLLDHRRGQLPQCFLRDRLAGVFTARQAHQCAIGHIGAAQQLKQVVFTLNGLAQDAHRFFGGQVARIDPGGFEPLCFT